mmetsp:Transcript_44591/g.126005  ORF Transcript_44591/g.126005 Transcript_44591/m.126005 type:complete len:232 (+) Transcript_44591:54-749(+)|eukprot:CAMPEP_0177225248 /NCGR_PEP_ID=MMETSP0367-20130122/39448_1 /TAXON_ID=447022 ORGANISM="Scrippsiella hangoei-like, Strain SHHI-4" /NCGR_SAMPLE_ID=MMETSP0367 /ASSEMBLY_ACC=CAM_ASM_000362 /LENGTH=231 /DNA_ID=CAMNT_0018675335 /DNA_START=56 /DNA_END=751 /DNA_ORIENTATION=-
MVFLSFNSAISPADELQEQDEAFEDAECLPATLRLRNRWVVWEQMMTGGGKTLPYSESTKQVATCETVEEFWQTWDRLPQPSELIANRMVHSVSDGGFNVVDALMIFCEGVAPQWEDQANAEGGHFQFQFKGSSGGGQIDEYWNNLVLGVIGATIEPLDMITGVRLVDKLSGTRGAGNLRMEVWFNQLRDPHAVQQLQHNVERCIGTKTLEGRIGNAPRAEIKIHKLTRHQ